MKKMEKKKDERHKLLLNVHTERIKFDLERVCEWVGTKRGGAVQV